METNQVFEYNGIPITFQIGNGDVMVNATEMAKPFQKETSQFLLNQQTKAFIRVLNAKLGFPSLDVKRGGMVSGTWMHQRLALKFAAWLSPEFELWVYERIEELLKHGFTALPDTLEEMISNPDLVIGLATRLKTERAERIRYQMEAIKQSEEIKKLTPKAEYYDEVLQSESTFLTTAIAKDLAMSAVALNLFLKNHRIQYNVRGRWVLYDKYDNRGYTKTTTFKYIDGTGYLQTRHQTEWTEKGREFIIRFVNENRMINK